MKSGQVLTDQKYKWYEPESWRFGDPSGDGYINYPRHASGQIYGVSSSVARYSLALFRTYLPARSPNMRMQRIQSMSCNTCFVACSGLPI